MSTKTPRTFAREFKIDLCRQIQSGQKRPAQLCREHQLTEGLLLRWRREFDLRGGVQADPAGVSGCARRASFTARSDWRERILMSKHNFAVVCICAGLLAVTAFAHA